MEWRDHDKDQQADLQDNLDHYETLTDKIALELAQVVKVGQNYRFHPTGEGPDPRELFSEARAEAQQSEIQRQQAWDALLALDGWEVTTSLMTLDLAHGIRSIFRDIAPRSQEDLTIKWHGREVTGRVYMRDLLDIAKRGALLPSINSAETGLDYAIFISATPAASQLDQLTKTKNDPRVLFWAPDDLTPSEQSLLVDFAAYRALVGDYRGRDDQLAKDVLGWVQGKLRSQMGIIYRIVPDSYGRGRITAVDHSKMSFDCQGELPAILTPLVAQVLDATYESREMEFDAPAPFNDTNAVNVINGIVKVGEIPRGTKPNRDISAAQNYGFTLQIMRRPNDRKLDLSECRYTRDMDKWITDKLGDSGATMPAVTVYKNFMGIGGPKGLNYGLSRRIVQLYLLCLVREGKIRITLSGSRAPVEAIDYTDIATIDFKVAVLDSFDQVQRLKPPKGWEILAPFAAVLLEDERLLLAHKDAEIQAGVQDLLRFRQEALDPFHGLRNGLDDLFQDIGRANPLEERLAAWEAFLDSEVDASNPIPFLRSALDKAFEYHVYRDDIVRQDELDDFAMRQLEVKQAQVFFQYHDRVLAAARYADVELPDEAALANIRATFEKAHASLEQLGELIASEARLLSELLDPVEEAIESYTVRYLQVFDEVTAHAEQVRQQIESLSDKPSFRVLDRLAEVEQLGADPRPGLQGVIHDVLEQSSQLFPTTLTHAEIERQLRHWPYPPQCALTLQNAGEWLQKADGTLSRCLGALQNALGDKASLLHSEVLRERLAQGHDEPFIAGLLAAQTIEEVADYLVEKLGGESTEEPDPVKLLARYLKKLRVRKLCLRDFKPSKRAIEEADVDKVVGEFRDFLLDALAGGDDELPVVELE